MSLFKWSSAYSVYLPEIDAEHREIYRLGNELHKALLAGAARAQLKPFWPICWRPRNSTSATKSV